MGSKKRHQLSNKELYRYKQSGLLGKEPSTWDKLWQFFTQLILLTLWRALVSAAGPVKRCFGLQIWMGKSLLAIALHIQRLLFRLIGWLSGRETSLCRTSNFYFGTDVKRWHVGLVAIILGSLVHTGYRRIQDLYDERKKRRKALHDRMLLSQSYQEWRSWALQIEKLDAEQAVAGGYKVPAVLEAYDRRLLLQKTTHLKRIRASGAVGEMMHAVRIDLIRNVANIAKSQRHCQNFVSVPEPIQCYMQEVKDQLQQICDWPDSELSVEDKLAFFRVTRHTFGRTALLLSGGGGLGIFHLGCAPPSASTRLAWALRVYLADWGQARQVKSVTKNPEIGGTKPQSRQEVSNSAAKVDKFL
ncbi:hypothetical protein DUNSADRAFT_6417 [Dunaliella salina]|uniref:Triacylglycerol lipase N-terminal domain-containing protein n=1 Tax=Dunaliella salina TaxID=3046 RepID=A0ABQ7H6U4_DUNSA|nr:hypothetical protein DUNSADRAFT_6417 [Dunaliella salina]|eukprot:KAF5842567.1 hypothetical protein DUNSADRAFT_6417 [Dunaliella salina]